jgi:transposase
VGLPPELGCGSGVTCWRRLRQWQQAGVWQRLHRAVLDRLAQHDLLDWSRAAVDSVRAKRRGALTEPSPTDRGKAGSKYHVLCDRNGLPLHALITGANAHDSTMLTPLLDTNPGVRERCGQPGRPRRRPGKLHADKGYVYPRCRRYLTRRGIGCGSPAEGSRTPPDSGGSGGSSSAQCPGCSTSAAWRCATTAPRPPSARCCRWPAP